MAITRLPSKPYDHEFMVRLSIDGGPELKGWLSPALDGPRSSARELILVTVSDNQLPPSLQSALQTFRTELRRLDGQGMSAAKRAVSAIQAGRSPLPNLRIAIHKMGPVPALQIPQSWSANAKHGATVVLFPRAIGDRERSHGLSTLKVDLFNCLVAVDTQRLFQTYYEDIFQHLREMSDKLNISGGIRRIKHVRDIQAQSIIEKIEALTPSPQSWRNYHTKRDRGERIPDTLEYKVCRWFEEHWPVIIEAVYVLCGVNRLIHDYCSIIGLPIGKLDLKLKSERFAFETVMTAFERVYGRRMETSDFSSMGESFSKIMEAYSGGDPKDLANVTDVDDISTGALEFALFVSLCRDELRRIYPLEQSLSRDALIFVSRRFISTFGEQVRDAVEVAAAGAGTTAVTTFVGDPGDVRMRERIKAQIWLSDATWAVIPELDGAAGENLDWTYLEPEHALVLKNPWLYVARSKGELSDALDRMESLQLEPLASTYARERHELRTEFLRRSRENIAITSSDEGEIVEQCRAALRRHGQRLSVARRRELLFGYLSFFGKDDIEAFDFMYQFYEGKSFKRREFVLSYARALSRDARFSTASLAELEKRADKTFLRAYDRCKRLAIVRKDQETDTTHVYQILQPLIAGGSEYRVQLIRIAKFLAGPGKYVQDNAANDDVQDCLSRFRR